MCICMHFKEFYHQIQSNNKLDKTGLDFLKSSSIQGQKLQFLFLSRLDTHVDVISSWFDPGRMSVSQSGTAKFSQIFMKFSKRRVIKKVQGFWFFILFLKWFLSRSCFCLFGPAYSSDNAGDGPPGPPMDFEIVGGKTTWEARIAQRFASAEFWCLERGCTVPKAFTNKSSMLDHIRRSHNKVDPRIYLKKYKDSIFPCEFCGLIFGDLRTHSKSCREKHKDNVPLCQLSNSFQSLSLADENVVENKDNDLKEDQSKFSSPSPSEPIPLSSSLPSVNSDAKPVSSVEKVVVKPVSAAQRLNAHSVKPVDSVKPVASAKPVPPVVSVAPVVPPVSSSVSPVSVVDSISRALPVRKISSIHLSDFCTLLIRLIKEILEEKDFGKYEEKVQAFLDFPSIFINKRGQAREKSVVSKELNNLLNMGKKNFDSVVKEISLQKDRLHLNESITSEKPQSAEDNQIRLTKKTMKLMDSGRFSSALGLLEGGSSVRALSRAEALLPDNLKKIKSLHPDATDKDLVPEIKECQGAEMERITAQQIKKFASSLAKEVAPGISSWTYELISTLSAFSDDFCEELANLFNRMIHGTLFQSTLWTSSRMIFLCYPLENNKLRPIAVTESLVRFLGRIVSSVLKEKIQIVMAPYQFGVAVPNGAEVIAHQAALVAHTMMKNGNDNESEDPLVVLSVDVSNAFNSIRKLPMFLAIKKHLPEIQKLFVWLYRGSSPQFLSSGEKIGLSATGVRQGDPLGPLFFCLGILDTLNLVANNKSVTPLGYMDDIQLIGKRSSAVTKFKVLKKEFEKIGLTINVKKTKLFDFTQPDGVIFDGLSVTNQGIKVLGGPIGKTSVGLGPDEFQENFVKKSLEDCAAVISDILKLLPPRYAFKLLSMCVNMRPMFLARITNPTLFIPAATRFDSIIDDALSQIVGWKLDFPGRCRTIRGLPRNLAGLGIRRLADVANCAFSASFLQVLPKFDLQIKFFLGPNWNILPDSYTLALTRSVPLFKCVNAFGEIEAYSSSEEALENAGEYLKEVINDSMHEIHQEPVDNPTKRKSEVQIHKLITQKELTKLLERATSTRFYRSLENNMDKAKYLSSKCGGISSWLDVMGWLDKRLILSPGDFQEALKHRLLFPLTSVNLKDAKSVVCGACKTSLDPSNSRHHSEVCMGEDFKALRTCRHSFVLSLLYDLFTSLVGSEYVKREVEIQASKSGRQARFADLTIEFGGVVYWIDLVIGSPVAEESLKQHSDTQVGATNRKRIMTKFSDWKLSFDVEKVNALLIPLAFETSGRPSYLVNSFFQKILTHFSDGHDIFEMKRKISYAMKLISTGIQRFNGKCMKNIRENLIITS